MKKFSLDSLSLSSFLLYLYFVYIAVISLVQKSDMVEF